MEKSFLRVFLQLVQSLDAPTAEVWFAAIEGTWLRRHPGLGGPQGREQTAAPILETCRHSSKLWDQRSLEEVSQTWLSPDSDPLSPTACTRASLGSWHCFPPCLGPDPE